METLLADLRHALRSLLRQPSFSLTASVTLALGIGGVSAMAALVQTMLLRPLPWSEPQELVTIRERQIGQERGRIAGTVNPGNFLAWRDRTHTFVDMAGFATGDDNLGLGGEALQASVAYVTGNFFDVLHLPTQLGRGLTMADSKPGSPDVLVISHGFWKRAFGGDPSVIGRKVVLGGVPTQIVGVAAAERDYPTASDVWVPLTIREEMRTARGRWMTVLGRMKPGVALADGEKDLVAIAAQLEKERPERNTNMTVSVRDLHDELLGEMRPALLLLTGAAAFVLLVACANVGNLLLLRGLARRRELALRAALGAPQGRLVRLLVVDALLLSVFGSLGAVLVARVFVGALVRLAPGQLPSFLTITPDLRAMLVGIVVGTAAMLAASLAPAFQAARLQLAPVLRDGGPGAGMGRERRRLGRVFVAFEVALACLLLAGTGLLLRSLDRLVHVDKGFETAHVTTFKVALPSNGYPEPVAMARFFDGLLAQVRAIPGVRSAGAMSWRPLGPGSRSDFSLPDRAPAPQGQEPSAEIRFVTPGLFETLGIRMYRGRDFGPQDTAGAPEGVIVNRRLAEKYWPGQDPIGKRINMEWGPVHQGEVIGVVGDVRLSSLDTEAWPTLYWSASQIPDSTMTFAVESDRPLASLEPELRRVVAGMDPRLAVLDAEPLERTLWESVERPVFTTTVATAFAGLALVLAGVGLFGIMARFVGDRRSELAVRLALGAGPMDVVRLVLREAMGLAVPGAIVGLLAAIAAGRALQSQLFGTSAGDPLVHAAAAGAVVLVALGTALLPAFRATRVAPALVLRAD